MASSSSFGCSVLQNPVLNKGTAFNKDERAALRIRGLLPPRVLSPETQMAKVYESFRRQPTPLDKYVYLQELADRNETLFYMTVMKHIEEMMPILYTPTVGEACQKFGHIFARPKGLYISINDKGSVADVIANWQEDDVRVIVVTDGERILGLGDQGAHGMPIPIGKLMLYTLCAGVHPRQCLPITIDVGTENKAFLEDERYIGLPQRRVRGEEYDELIDEFVKAVEARFPKATIQFEDFDNRNAFRLLHKYQNISRVFNDDIQGTSAVTLAGIYSALRVSKTALKDHKFLFLGAGEAGIGIGDLIVSGLMAEGVSEEEARKHCWFVDSRGLVVSSRSDLTEHKKPFAHDAPFAKTLHEAVMTLRPTAIIGVAGQGRAFTKEIVEAMCSFNERPIVFALSNPTSCSECTAQEAINWSRGKAIFATGSPFAPVEFEGKTYVIGQCNNSYIFPALGLAGVVTGTRHYTNEMFLESAKSLAAQVSDEDLATGCIFPSMRRIRSVEAKIAEAVGRCIYKSGLATVPEPADLLAAMTQAQYVPTYQSYA